MNFVGKQIDLPCRHGRATPPRVAGEHRKRCRTCRTTFVLIVEPTVHLEPKLGTEVLHARWLLGELFAIDLDEGTDPRHPDGR